MIYKLLFAGVVLIGTLTSANGQDKEVAAVANAVEKLRQAMVDGKKEALESIASDKLSYGHSSGVVDNKADFVDKIASGKTDFVTIELKDQTISVSGSTAIVRHRLDAITNDNGKPGEAHIAVLLIFQNDHKQWKLLARQAVKIAQ